MCTKLVFLFHFVLTFRVHSRCEHYVFRKYNDLSILIFQLPCLIIILLCNVYMAEDEKAWKRKQ